MFSMKALKNSKNGSPDENMRKILLIVSLIASWTFTHATTWDEPWHDEVVKNADSFVFAEIQSFDEQVVKIKIIRSLAGVPLSGEIEITNYYLLNICSTSGGHGPEFHFENVKQCYFFLKKNDKEQFCLATPTTGFASVNEGKVMATYRHSYHQAIVPITLYEDTQTAIFNHYHQKSFNKLEIKKIVDENLAKIPAKINEQGMDLFFAQHVALELIYHLRLEGYESQLLPFLMDDENVHNALSGARAMITCNTESGKQALMKIIEDPSRDNFVQVMCIWSLAEFNPASLKKQLANLAKTASEDENGFGGNIMDPRVCTHIPDVKRALNTLVQKL